MSTSALRVGGDGGDVGWLRKIFVELGLAGGDAGRGATAVSVPRAEVAPVESGDIVRERPTQHVTGEGRRAEESAAIRSELVPLDSVAVVLSNSASLYDPAAVAVYVEGLKIGQLDRDDARRLLGAIDAMILFESATAPTPVEPGDMSSSIIDARPIEPMSELGIAAALATAGFPCRRDTNPGFAVQPEDNRFKVTWTEFHHDARDTKLRAMSRSLREAGYRARVARNRHYPYVSVAGTS